MSVQQYTKAQLTAALQDWPDDQEAGFVAAIPEIIRLGETKLLRDLDLTVLDVETTVATAIGVETVTKPVLMTAETGVWYTSAGVRTFVRKRSRDFVLEHGRTGATGLPRYYCDASATTWALSPIPSAVLTLNVRGIQPPVSLADVAGGGDTTWLSRHFGDMLLNACLISAMRYLKNTARMQEADAYYNDHLPQARAQIARLRRTDQLDVVAGTTAFDAPSGAADKKG